MRHVFASSLLCLNRAVRVLAGGGHGLRILLLHDTPGDQLPALDALTGWLGKSGRLVSPEEAEAWLVDPAARRAKPNPCLISFDDGFASNMAAAAVLERHGTRGLFFVCPALMELGPDEQRRAIAANVFDGKRDAAALPAAMRLMNWAEVGDLARAGHGIGNHTLSHQRLTLLDTAECEAEIRHAADALARHCPHPVNWFAFPFGGIGSVAPGVLATAGVHHRYCRSGVRGANPPGVHRLALRADHIDLDHPAAYLHLIAEGGLDLRYRSPRRTLDGMAASCGLS